MASLLEFETPENVQIAYRPAGLGTRYCAWLLDAIFVFLLAVALFLLTLFFTAAAGIVLKKFGKFEPANDEDVREFMFYAIAVGSLFFGLGSLIYFSVCELIGRGQTFGKQICGVRVVKTDGFSLDAGSILVRNIFRIVDQIPPLWIVPVLSSRSQRFGDMVAGTVVVADASDRLGELRTSLLKRPAAECKFRFDGSVLARALPVDIEAAERLLERWRQLPGPQFLELLNVICDPLARRLGAQPPDVADRQEFLQDFLSAIYHREARRLG
jgi:uncharacterized RDD family membrane protein YckC